MTIFLPSLCCPQVLNKKPRVICHELLRDLQSNRSSEKEYISDRREVQHASIFGLGNSWILYTAKVSSWRVCSDKILESTTLMKWIESGCHLCRLWTRCHPEAVDNRRSVLFSYLVNNCVHLKSKTGKIKSCKTSWNTMWGPSKIQPSS